MSEPDDATINAVAKALHVYHGVGYCSSGPHTSLYGFACYDEARVVINAVNGVNVPTEGPGTTDKRTLSAKSKKRVK